MRRSYIVLTAILVLGFAVAFGACSKLDVTDTTDTTVTGETGDAKKTKDTMLIYFGKEYVDDGEYPIFEYYFPSEEFENTEYAHLVMVYKGDYKDSFKYGDIVTTSIPVDISSFDLSFRKDGDVTYNPYADFFELDPATSFSLKGSVFEDFEKKTMTVTNTRYWADYEDNFSTITMKDDEGKVYSYSYLWRNPEEGRPDILNMNIGDKVDFALFGGNAIFQLSDPVGIPQGDHIVPDSNGTFNEDEFFIYIGRDEGDPVFHYLTPDDDSLKSRSVFYKGSLPDGLKYGDVFVAAPGEIKITRTRNTEGEMMEWHYRISDELDCNTGLEYIGSGFDLMPKKTLIVDECDYIGFYLFCCNLVEPDYSARYSFDYFSTVNEVTLNNVDTGKTVEFICYKDTLILPAPLGE